MLNFRISSKVEERFWKSQILLELSIALDKWDQPCWLQQLTEFKDVLPKGWHLGKETTFILLCKTLS